MTLDCFIFFNELDTLEIRLETLPKATRFVLVEATTTHSGKPKPLYYAEHKNRFQKFHDRITHVVVDDMPLCTGDRWLLENFQRNAIMRELKNAQPDDLILISDVDEIPNPARVKERAIGSYEQDLFAYFYNCKSVSEKWPGTIGIKYADLLKTSPQALRNQRAELPRVTGGGGVALHVDR